MSHRLRGALAAAVVALPVVGLAVASATGSGPRPAGPSALPPIKHVWTIVLENEDYAEWAGQDVLTGSAYLHKLALEGAFVPNYFGTGHSSGDNYTAMISGQGPTPDTQDDCSDDSVVGGDYEHSAFGFDADGQALGDPAKVAAGEKVGCTYAADVMTVVDQLKAARLTWRGYMEDIDASPTKLRTTCQAARWATQLNAPKGAKDEPFNDYKRKHDPFEYFHSITGLEPASGSPSDDCDDNVVPMHRLVEDLKRKKTTPSFSFITPDQCHDGHDNPTCKDGSSGGVAAIDAFLPSIVDPILASPAYADGGLLVITFDEGTEGFACCGEKHSANLSAINDNGLSSEEEGNPVPLGGLPLSASRGGGQTGALMLSPYIAPRTVTTSCYNHYSYLRSVEDIFRLTPKRTGIAGSDGEGHLGYAGALGDGVVPTMIGEQVMPCTSPAAFGADIFTNAKQRA